MAKRQEDPPAGAPAWMSTFSDLMNLLLTFFVLLFSMSTIEESKLEEVAVSMQSAFSLLSSTGSSIINGQMISAGISQTPDFANYFGDSLSEGNGSAGGDSNSGGSGGSGTSSSGNNQNSDSSGMGNGGKNNNDGNEDGGSSSEQTTEEAQEQVEEAATKESEQMAQDIEEQVAKYGIQDYVEVDFNGQYVRFTLSGALLFDSGSAELTSKATPLLKKLSRIIDNYQSSLVEVEGHTDNVPIHSATYEDNNVLSMYRALYVADEIRKYSSIPDSHIFSSGRGSYDPVASNKTPEGRARNRRVEIKIYNSYNSEGLSDD